MCACVCVYLSEYAPHEYSAYRGQRMASGHLKLESQVVIRYVRVGN